MKKDVMLGLDSYAIIDLCHNKFPPSEFFSSFAICNIVFYETFTFAKGKDVDFILSLWKGGWRLSFDEGSMWQAVAIQKEARGKGRELALADCLIAASYLSAGITKILTRNVKDFEGIPGLEVVGY